MYNWLGNAGPSGHAPIATDGNGVPTPLQRIRSELPHLDLTGRVFDEGRIKEARGGYADVFVGYVLSECLRYRGPTYEGQGRVKVAIKRLQIRLDKSVRFAKWIEREMKIWSRLDHPNILPFLGYMFEKDWPSLISEWMDNGTLKEFMEKQSKIDILHLARGIAEGMKYMHDKKFVHSDLKSDNVLIGKYFQPLICDFGISRMLDPTQSGYVSATRSDNPRGTIRWMAPELLAPEEGVEASHSKETDVWAYGMVLYEMISKKVPYTRLWRDAQVISAIGRGRLPSLPDFKDVMMHSSLPRNAYLQICRICKECWAKRPDKRLTMPEITRVLALVFDEIRERQATTVNLFGLSLEGPVLVEMNQQMHNVASQAHPSQSSQWPYKVPTVSNSEPWQTVFPPLFPTEQQQMPQGVLPQLRKPETHAKPMFGFDQTFLQNVDLTDYGLPPILNDPLLCRTCQRTFPDFAAFKYHYCRIRPSFLDSETLRELFSPARATYHNADVETGQQMFSGNAQSRNDPQVSSSRMIGVDLPLSFTDTAHIV
ncbi:hypothetical protein ACEPAF_9498 [Sanghuangporus sanghuang]